MIPIRDNIPDKKRPYVSWLIIFLCISIFLAIKMLGLEQQRQIIYQFGMVPIRYTNPQWSLAFGLPPDYCLSFLTSLFLHGGWFHLLLNVWFMYIFANHIEDCMGHVKFLFFYLICGLLATYLQWYFEPELVIPVVGASGAIAGVLGAYFVMSPFARVVIWVPLFFLPIFFQVPAIAFLGFWVIIQIQNATSTVLFENVATGVAWWSHLGGFIMGVILHRFFISDSQDMDR